MPRFFFNIYDGVSILDEVGTELPNAREAQIQAVRHAGIVIAESAKRLRLDEYWCLEVTDETGIILFRLEFHVATTAATLHLKKDPYLASPVRHPPGLKRPSWTPPNTAL